MWRAVFRSMYSSALKALTSPAILVSKFVVSKWVIRPIPETPSTRFDQTVSTSLPIGVINPMPVTATRRPLELDLTFTQQRIRTWRPTNIVTGCEKERSGLDLVSKPSSDKPSNVQRQLQAKPACRGVEVGSEELAQLVQAVQNRVAVEVECRGGRLHRTRVEISLQRFQELLRVLGLGIEQRAEAVGHEALRKAGILGEDKVRDHLVVSMRHGVGAQLPAGFDGLLRLQV